MKYPRLLYVATFVLFSLCAPVESFASPATPPGKRVEIQNSRGLPALNGYLTRPTIKGDYPAVLILIGSGPGSTDNPTRDYNPFARLAEDLARNGFASLRFDKRGTGYNGSTGRYELQSLDDYVADAEDAMRTLSRQSGVRRNGVYLFGHSLGTLVAARLAAQGQAQGQTAGLILSAGPSGELLSVMEEQQIALQSLLFAGDIRGFEKAIRAFLLPFQQVRDGEFATCPEGRCTTAENGVQLLDGQTLAFWRQAFNENMHDRLAQVPARVPRFCLGGASDWIVDAAHARINCRTAHIVPEMDHFFAIQPSKEASIRFFLKPDMSRIQLHPRFTDSVIRWLKTVEAAYKAGSKPFRFMARN